MKTVNTTVDDNGVDQKQKDEDRLGSAIKLVINLESAFKLYSYRCMGHESFMENVKTCVGEWYDEVSKLD